jgi:hypothetical protein
VRKLLHIAVALFLSCCIVWGYTGIHVFKMVCSAENGKAVVSFTNVSNSCENHQQPRKKSCCSHESAPQQEVAKSCCTYSYFHQNIEDESVTTPQQNSTNHYLQSIALNSMVCNNLNPLAVIRLNEVKPPNPPPAKHPKQGYLSLIQTYLI